MHAGRSAVESPAMNIDCHRQGLPLDIAPSLTEYIGSQTVLAVHELGTPRKELLARSRRPVFRGVENVVRRWR